ncbi:hypothetical protein [Brachybacterium huguangmaarense]
MSDADRPEPYSRRPSYGLPGPTPANDHAPANDPAPADGTSSAPFGSPAPAPYGSPAQTPFGSPAPAPGADVPGAAAPTAAPAAMWGAGPAPDPQGHQGRRSGLVPLLIGIVSLLLAAAAVVIGVVMMFGAVMTPVSYGMQEFESTTTVEVADGEMLLVFVPSDAPADATCTATADTGALQQVPQSSEMQDPATGATYRAQFGVAADADSTITLTCDGTGAWMGPISMSSFMKPLLIGGGVGLVLGVLGLVLLIVGIVLLVRTRRRRA